MALFKKERKYFALHTHGVEGTVPEAKEVLTPSIPEGLYHKCRHCEKLVLREDLEKNLKICPKCGGYERMGAWERIDMILDPSTFREINDRIVGKNPLDFPDYEKKIEQVQKHSGLNEAMVTGYGRIDGVKVAVGVMDASFIMGSMGSAVGEKAASLVEFATFYKLPLILFSASGGARMQEGIMSLMQMTKVSYALRKHHEEGLLYISVPTDPTTGGVTASFAMLGDFIIAEPKTLIGFAGRRVIEGTIKKKLPEDFQSAEFLLQKGFLDAVVKREELRKYLGRILRLHEGGVV